MFVRGGVRRVWLSWWGGVGGRWGWGVERESESLLVGILDQGPLEAVFYGWC